MDGRMIDEDGGVETGCLMECQPVEHLMNIDYNI